MVDVLNRGKTVFALARAALKKTPYLATKQVDPFISENITDKNYSNPLNQPDQKKNKHTDFIYVVLSYLFV